MSEMRGAARSFLLAIAVTAFGTIAEGQSPQSPLKYKGPPTQPAITAADAMTRLYVFADDSMMGRGAGEEGGLKGTAYIEREVLATFGDDYRRYMAVVPGFIPHLSRLLGGSAQKKYGT